MSLSIKQQKFSQDTVTLLLHAMEHGYRFTFGEAWRPQEMQDLYLQQGKTTVKTSQHLHRLAIDINFFKPVGAKFELTYDKKDLQFLGDFWESLDEKNRWGGNFVSFLDTPHFERRL